MRIHKAEWLKDNGQDLLRLSLTEILSGTTDPAPPAKPGKTEWYLKFSNEPYAGLTWRQWVREPFLVWPDSAVGLDTGSTERDVVLIVIFVVDHVSQAQAALLAKYANDALGFVRATGAEAKGVEGPWRL